MVGTDRVSWFICLGSWTDRSALDTLLYFGTHTTSAATRDRLLSELFGPNHHERLITSLTSLAVIVFIIDNYQVGQCLKNQQSGHSSNFMSGTNQIAEKPRLYDNPEYNNVKPKSELQYNCNETYPSPDGMAPYESLDRKSHAAFFTTHFSIFEMERENDFGTDKN